MADNKMLIDATHPEETRVVVLRSGRVEEFDYESAARKLLRGNIYLAKVTRVEPALQAAFVDYGGNRHGFLAFNEIHPDYYQIPIADRQALIDEEAEAEAVAEAEVDARAERIAAKKSTRRRRGGRSSRKSADAEQQSENNENDNGDDKATSQDIAPSDAPTPSDNDNDENTVAISADHDDVIKGEIIVEQVKEAETEVETGAGVAADEATTSAQDLSPPEAFEGADFAEENAIEVFADAETEAPADTAGDNNGDGDENETTTDGEDETADADGEPVEEVVTSPDALEELPSRPRRSRRSYKIQEVIKRRQVILIQVVKEERGNKGAALTTYLSLAGRYTVLMPNTARGGGISRKITNPQDRKRLKAIAHDLEVPEGMGLIIRTAGAARTKQEIQRDFEYLLRLWESVREMTLDSTAPALVYEEGNLIKRSIRDLYNKDIDEVLVAGPHAYKEAKGFMRMLMPSHAKNVVHYKDSQPLYTRYQIERQLNAMFSPFVTLKSGGYLVINQTEALVAVDVNSGKSTREFSIEETALKTNLEAAEETARQLRLRDLAGLVVIDFIDMDERRNNRAVERCMKDALRYDRSRIQVGRISHFGLLEMSRQRLRTGVLEGSTTPCPHCQGTGIVRATESVSLAVLRGLEDAVMAGGRHSLVAKTTPTVALYILNNKRDFVVDMEARHGMPITVEGSDKIQGANFTIEKGPAQAARANANDADKSVVNMDWGFEDENGASEAVSGSQSAPPSGDVEDENTDRERPRRRRRRGRRGRGRGGAQRAEGDENNTTSSTSDEQPDTRSEDDGQDSVSTHSENETSNEDGEEKPRRRRRRGRRGGRRSREREATTGVEENGENGARNDKPYQTEEGRDGETSPSSETEAAETSVDETVVEKPKRTPRPRRRRPAAEKVAADKGDDASSSVGEAPTVADREIATASSSHSSAATRPEPEPVAQPATQKPSESETSGAPRRGWWQRRLFGED